MGKSMKIENSLDIEEYVEAGEYLPLSTWKVLCAKTHRALDEKLAERNKLQEHQLLLIQEQFKGHLERIDHVLSKELSSQCNKVVKKEEFDKLVKNSIMEFLSDDGMLDLIGKTHNEIRDIIAERMTTEKVEKIIKMFLDSPEQQDILRKSISIRYVFIIVAVVFSFGVTWAMWTSNMKDVQQDIQEIRQKISPIEKELGIDTKREK
jgi:hypothetical protein